MKISKKVIVITAVLALVSCIVSYSMCDRVVRPLFTERFMLYSDPDEAKSVLGDMRYIAHASGAVRLSDGREMYGSNSLEGLEKCAESGVKILELDFNFTSDGFLACVHNWSGDYSPDITDGVPLTIGDFLKCRIYGELTPVWLGDAAKFLREHDGVRIVTDIKDDNVRGMRQIAEFCPDLLDRFIVQIYSEEEYDAAVSFGFEYIVYTLYKLDWNGKTDVAEIMRFVAERRILAVAAAHEMTGVEDYTLSLVRHSVPVLLYTVNSREEQLIAFASGVSGVYTDVGVCRYEK